MKNQQQIENEFKASIEKYCTQLKSLYRPEATKKGIEMMKELKKKINAFGQMVNREKAYEIIVNDITSDICYANNTDVLEDLIMMGWKSLYDWTNEELEDYIDGLCIENQPNGKI